MKHNGDPAFQVVAIFVGVLCYGRVLRSFFTGEIVAGGSGRLWKANRSESPVYYWFTVVWYVGIATLFLWGAFFHGPK